MFENTHLEIATDEAERLEEISAGVSEDLKTLEAQAGVLARGLAWMPGVRASDSVLERSRRLRTRIEPLLRRFRAPLPTDAPVSDDVRWLHDNIRLVDMELHDLGETLKPLRKTPHVYTPSGQIIPRAAAVAEGYLTLVQYQFSESRFTAYVRSFQQVTVLNLKELFALVPALKLCLLEQIAVRAAKILEDQHGSYSVGLLITSLRDTTHTCWKEMLEPLIAFDGILRKDPTGTYPRMDFESRELYRKKVAKTAQRSDRKEMAVAEEALELAREAEREKDDNPRLALRRSHIGYYLLAEGRDLLDHKVRFRPNLGQRIQGFLRRHPDEFYLPGIEILTLAIMSLCVVLLTPPYSSPGLIFLAMLALLLPCSQSAVQLMNYLTTSLLRPEILPKLDFSKGIPNDCVSLVAVPTLLLNESQVHRLVQDLEVRFLGNRDRNLHFVLLTDLPDSRHSPREDSPLVDLCAALVDQLNEKYREQAKGSFLLLHRHRVYNPREKVWMGWERKRGKLLDLNQLLRQECDNFPVKVGDLSILSQVRFVITVDSDTELPRGTAQRLIGALAHPLNQAIIDPERNIVVAGYGILQPRVGISVQSTAKSRLAAIYSGETGFDIYTRAISDVYQDLFGEGIFAGKGIYEVETLHRVLDRRFPRNALLSHDLIEGAYARAGLVSDIEIIEDYPSHYRAYNRRKHRWLRGDWQITAWLFSRVHDESGQLVPNPISLISQWKILDNLRRSLVEPASLLLFLLGWTVLPGPAVGWTVAAVAILFVPTWCRFGFEVVRSVIERKSGIFKDAVQALFAANVSVLLNLIFMAHQMLLSLDAVVRTLVRRLFTRQRLLQWETAAEVELGTNRRTPLDIYLQWTPALALGLGLIVWFVNPRAIFPALPILLLWASSKMVSLWLNRPPRARYQAPGLKEKLLLRIVALHTWRYFAEFSNAEHHWLIPDNVRADPFVVVARVSTTNAGLLLNTRQVACELGYLQLDEFAEQSQHTLDTLGRLERHRGHLFNWYDGRTLAPLDPKFVSTVDNGNLVASLWTLEQGCWDRLCRPLFEHSVADGFLDHLRVLADLEVLSRERVLAIERQLAEQNWLDYLFELPDSELEPLPGVKSTSDVRWFERETRRRLESFRRAMAVYCPWRLPEFRPLRRELGLEGADRMPVEVVPDFIDRLTSKLELAHSTNGGNELSQLRERLRLLLAPARSNTVKLIDQLKAVAHDAGKLANEMDFNFLLDSRRKLLSIGYDAGIERLHAACYDLLASEARIATFVAIAKNEIPQDTWFRLGRVHTKDHGRPVLLSWTGTMFEYLMPAIWMRSYPETILDRAQVGAMRAQQAYIRKNIPWGISESSYSKREPDGSYGYCAFGVPNLALREQELDALVISPYSTFLALLVDPVGALGNIRKMARRGWCSRYGFYEAVDFTPQKGSSERQPELVRCWMAHHQGMSLASIANFLCDGIVVRWFHSNPQVQATELLLHEKPLSHLRPVRAGFESNAL